MSKNVILRFTYHQLRNEAHAEYHEVVDAILKNCDPDTLKYRPQYNAYHTAYNTEIGVLDVVQKSPYTQEIVLQDELRDRVYMGFTTAVQSVLYHFNETKRKAAERVETVIKSYGDVAHKTYDQETSAIDDMLRELFASHSDALNVLGMDEWTDRLAAENEQFKTLMDTRYKEKSQRPKPRMADARKTVDALFTALLDYIEALVTIAGDTSPYETLIAELNAVSTRYRNLLAQQQGRRKAAAKPSPESGN